MPENDVLDVEVQESSSVNLEKVESSLSVLEEKFSSVDEKVEFFVKEYNDIKEKQKKELEELEGSSVVGLEEVISSIGVLNESVEKMNENIFSLNSSLSLLMGLIFGISVVSYIWKGVLKNVF